MLVAAGLLTAEHCIIEQHTNVGQGSVLYASGGFIVFGVGTVFRNNTAIQAGSLLRIDAPANVRIENSIVSGSCLKDPDAMWTEIGTPPRMLKTLGQVMDIRNDKSIGKFFVHVINTTFAVDLLDQSKTAPIVVTGNGKFSAYRNRFNGSTAMTGWVRVPNNLTPSVPLIINLKDNEFHPDQAFVNTNGTEPGGLVTPSVAAQSHASHFCRHVPIL